jgi:hypothetical protein
MPSDYVRPHVSTSLRLATMAPTQYIHNTPNTPLFFLLIGPAPGKGNRDMPRSSISNQALNQLTTLSCHS